MTKISAIDGYDAFATSCAAVPYAGRVVGVAVAVLVVTPVPTLLRNAVKRLDDSDRVPRGAGYIDRVALDVTVVVVQHGGTWRSWVEVKK